MEETKNNDVLAQEYANCVKEANSQLESPTWEMLETAFVTGMQKNQETADEFKDKWIRSVADYQNLKRTMQKEYSEAFDRGRISMLATLLPAIDDLERSLTNEVDYKGVKLIYDKLMSLIGSCSIEKINPKDGDEFDCDLCEAMFVEENDNEALSGKIRSTLIPGYKMTNTLLANPIIRHAKVTTWK